MIRERIFRAGWPVGLALGVALCVLWAVASPTDAEAGSISKKLKRQINVMEEVIDEILVESSYLLVYSSDPTHGVYLEEFGAIFGFEASLVGGRWDFTKGLEFLDKIHIESEDGKTVIWIDDDDDEKQIEIIKKKGGDEDEDEDEDAIKKLKQIREKSEKKGKNEEECYTKGKDELIEGLVDYGEILTGLRDDEWIAVTAFLKKAELFKRNEISRLVLRVRMRDLRAHADDDISRETLLDRVVVDEY
jgi:hypothetical protein